MRAIEAYERSLPDAYLGLWRELDILGRARAAIAKVTSPLRKTAAAFGLGRDPAAAVREECGPDAQAFDRDMRADRDQRRPVLDIRRAHRSDGARGAGASKAGPLARGVPDPAPDPDPAADPRSVPRPGPVALTSSELSERPCTAIGGSPGAEVRARPRSSTHGARFAA